MEELREHGVFWLPWDEDKTLTGELIFDHEHGTRLTVIGSFDLSAEYEVSNLPRILGVIGPKRVTLHECTVRASKHISSGITQQTFRAQYLLLGNELNPDDDAEFDCTYVVFEHLNAWLQRGGFEVQNLFDNNRFKGLVVAFKTPASQIDCFSRGELAIHTTFSSPPQPITSEATITKLDYFYISYSQRTGLDDLLSDVERLRGLMVLCLDEDVASTTIRFQRADIPERAINGRVFEGTMAPFEYRAQPISRREPRVLHEHLLPLTVEKLGGLNAVARWLDVAPKYERVLGMILSARAGRALYVENRFLNVAGGAEAYHRLAIGGEMIPGQKFDELRELAVAAMPNGKARSWLKGRLRYNEPSLERRLIDLATKTAPATGDLVGDITAWARTVAGIRNRLVHISNSNPKEFDSGALYWLSESVFAVTRVALLMECGLSDDALRRIKESRTVAGITMFVRDALRSASQTLNSMKNPAE